MATSSSPFATTTPTKGVAGRTDYETWEKRTLHLTKQLEEEEHAERKENASALGVDGKHARSQAEADERSKARDSLKAKAALDAYRKREQGLMENMAGLLGSLDEDGANVNDNEEKHQGIRYITRDILGPGKRVLTVCDTKGPGKIVLTEDLSNLESATPANSSLQPKSYKDDAENREMLKPNVHRGLIKLNLNNLHQCTVVVKCKIITGTVEISHCEDVTLIAEGDDATVVTVQADLCNNLDIQFHDSPSGKNLPLKVRDTNSGPTTTLFWGQDQDDRIYHAGVSKLRVATYHHGYADLEIRADYIEDGAKAVGNASAEEVQFVTSVVDGDFTTERVLMPGETKGVKQGPKPMTERELKALGKKKSQIDDALDEKLKAMVRIKHGLKSIGNSSEAKVASSEKSMDEDVVEEVFASTTKDMIDGIVFSIEEEKAKGNEAFKVGEYAQAVLFYTMALDRAADLPDANSISERRSNLSSPSSKLKQLFPRHILLSNRSACFLKMGHHEKALKDGADAVHLDPTYVKGIFRKGLALHAMGRYEEAIGSLASAHKLEPKNKQINQALKFAEVRMSQEMRKRMQR